MQTITSYRNLVIGANNYLRAPLKQVRADIITKGKIKIGLRFKVRFCSSQYSQVNTCQVQSHYLVILSFMLHSHIRFKILQVTHDAHELFFCYIEYCYCIQDIHYSVEHTSSRARLIVFARYI